MVLKLERFSHLSNRSFGLDSSIGLGYLSLVISLRAIRNKKGLPGRGLPDATKEGPECEPSPDVRLL